MELKLLLVYSGKITTYISDRIKGMYDALNKGLQLYRRYCWFNATMSFFMTVLLFQL
jgi:hypothetical protein